MFEAQITAKADTSKARVYYQGGHVEHFDSQSEAYQTWLGLPKGVRAAFRAAGDTEPVYAHDFVDRM